jgi:hypothetical protein
MRSSVNDIHHRTGNVFAETPTYLYNGNPNSLAAAFANKRNTQEWHLPLILICLACRLNQSSGQSRFVQKLMFLKFLSNNGINIFTAFKTPS